MSDTRQHVHELVDRLPESRLEALREHIQAQLDPISRNLSHAPFDDEPETEEERKSVEDAKEWLRHNPGIPMEEILAEFGLTMADFEEMGRTPLPRVKKN